MNNVVELRNISRYYAVGDNIVKALDNVSLSIEKGEYTSIMGPSGSGKSTMMNIIGCLDTPNRGIVSIGGKITLGLNEKELARIRNKEVGFVFQQFNLLSKLNALENVITPLLYSDYIFTNKEKIELASYALERVGLKERIKHRPNELSGGQKQRVAIARALVTSPSIILADEPTGALDQKTGHQIMDLFEELVDEGKTVIIVTHDIDLGKRAKNQVHMLDGKIKEIII